MYLIRDNYFRWLKIESEYKLPLLIIVLAILSRLALIELPKVNLEFAFVYAVNYFSTNDKYYIDTYFQYQANTLGTSYVVHLLYKILPYLDILTLGRLLSIMGLFLIGCSVLIVSKKLGHKGRVTNIILLFVLFNPMLWIYSGRFTADVFPLSIGLFGLALLYESNSTLKYYISSALIGVSIVLKYHSVIYLLIALLYIYFKDRRLKNGFFLFCLLPVVFVLSYLIVVLQLFDFFIAPQRYQNVHKLNLVGWFSNASSYASYIVLIFSPFSIILVVRSFIDKTIQFRIGIILSVVLFGVGALFFHVNNGEMNFGPFDKFISPQLYGFYQSLGLMLVLILHYVSKDINRIANNDVLRTIFFACIIFIVVFSFTRPSQRYLLYILPFMYLLLLGGYEEFIKLKIIVPLFSIFIILNFYSSINQYVVGAAADSMAKQIFFSGYLKETYLGAIKPHVGDVGRKGYGRASCGRYEVVHGKRIDSLIVTEKSLFGLVSKSYSLVKSKC